MTTLYVSDVIPFDIETGSMWEIDQNCIIQKFGLYDLQ